MPKRTTRDLRYLNRRRVLETLYFGGPVTRLELSARLGLSPATVTNVVSDLLGEGLVLETGTLGSNGGRPSVALGVNPRYGSFIGVGVGETHIHCDLFDFTLTPRDHVRFDLTGVDPDPDLVRRSIGEGVRTLLGRSGLAPAEVKGVGIGVPGIVDSEGRVSVFAQAWHWDQVPLQVQLEDDLRLPIYLDNGAQSMALAEMWFGAGRGVENLVVVLLGTGVGAGIILGGKLYRSLSNSAGEFGHTCVSVGGWACRCGGRGCVEAYVGAPGIIRRWQGESHDMDQVASVEALRAAYEAGDAKAQATVYEVAEYLGVGLANLVNLINPRRIVLGGWVGELLGEPLLPEVRRAVSRQALRVPLAHLNIVLSDLKREAVSKGAAALVLEDFLRQVPVSLDEWPSPGRGKDVIAEELREMPDKDFPIAK